MVKISIKKDKKAKAKPKQKQKQKQSQKVIVNIGSNATRAKRRSTLERNKAVNRSTPTPNIIIPQSMPQNSMSEIFKYIRDAEQQKEIIKKQEKNNELERDKLKEKKPPTIPTEEKAQVQFTMVNSQNISGISSGLATPQFNPLSTPLNYRSLQNELGKLIQRADLEGENPNTGRLSLSTYNPLNISSNSSIITDPGYIDDNDSVLSYESRTPLKHTPNQNSLIDLLKNETVEQEDEEVYIEPETEQKTIINETSQQEAETQGEPLEIITNEPSQIDAVIIDTPEPEKTSYEQADEALTIIDQVMNPTKGTTSKQAEEPQRMIEIKTVDDEQILNLTPEQRKNIRNVQVDDVATARKVEEPSKQVLAKWRDLKKDGALKDFQLYKNGRIRATDLLLDEINTIDPSWEPIPTNRVGGRKKKIQ